MTNDYMLSSMPLTDKEARKQARMIRNRNAAQASRDRKKEHAAWLEARVAQLEAQLNLAPSMNPSSLPALPATMASAATTGMTTTTATATTTSSSPSSSRQASLAPDAVIKRDSADVARIHELEDENDVLRARLQAEQDETTRLRKRLESLEDKFVRLEQFMSAPLSTSAPDPAASLPSPSSFSSLSDSGA
ncbi:hypothetical protein OIO90_006652, partial [Microbotryomycetes sp. JL221]